MAVDPLVLAEAHRLQAAIGFTKPPLSTLELIDGLFPEIEVIGMPTRKHGNIDVYREPQPDGKQAIIVYSEFDHASTQRFSIAHEVGHWIFDCQRGAAIPAEWSCGDRRAPAERRANAFAAELLVPLAMLDRLVRFNIAADRTDEDELAEWTQHCQRLASRFNVSLACMKARIGDLGRWRKDR